MSKFQFYSTEALVRYFMAQGKEGECWDFKQEWHENIADLLKDIICFANTVHDENCYIIFGISDDLTATGMKKPRRKQADIIDAISNLVFAGDIYPKVEIRTITIDGTEIDVLTILNIENTPIYLKKAYGQMRPGCIYLRTGDKNTPDGGNADMPDIENLWRKRLGLTKPPLEYIYDRLHNRLEWTERDDCFYNIYRPEYTLEIIYDGEQDLDAEFYAYAMPNESTSYEELKIKYQNTVLDSYQLVILDGGRLRIPTPEWGYLCHDEHSIHSKYCYKYYISGSNRYRLLKFLYDPQDGDHRYAFMHLQDVVLFYRSEEERVAFEVYIEANQSALDDKVKSITRYDYIQTENACKTDLYKSRLKAGVALNDMLSEWRTKTFGIMGEKAR